MTSSMQSGIDAYMELSERERQIHDSLAEAVKKEILAAGRGDEPYCVLMSVATRRIADTEQASKVHWDLYQQSQEENAQLKAQVDRLFSENNKTEARRREVAEKLRRAERLIKSLSEALIDKTAPPA